jgi:hypothetical protein
MQRCQKAISFPKPRKRKDPNGNVFGTPEICPHWHIWSTDRAILAKKSHTFPNLRKLPEVAEGQE